jgi:hypothetical protein
MSAGKVQITLELFVNTISELKTLPKFATLDKIELARQAYEHLFFCAEMLEKLEEEYQPIRKWSHVLYGDGGRMVPVQQAAIDITRLQDEDDAWDQLYQTLFAVMHFQNDETYPPMDPDKLMRLWDRCSGMPEFLIPKLKSEYARRKEAMTKLGEEGGSQESE